MEAAAEAHTDQPSQSFAKPFAYVKPLRLRTAAFAESTRPSERGRSRPAGRGTPLERGHRGETGRPAELAPQARPGHSPGPEVELDRPQAEPGHPVGPGAEQMPPFPSTEAATARGHAQSGPDAGAPRPWHRAALAPLWPGPQGAPEAAAHWTTPRSPAMTAYVCTQYTPLAGSALFLTHTSWGSYVFGVPVFFTHIAHADPPRFMPDSLSLPGSC
ncbi:hypothetical protein J0S82_013517 [Galemys pyrenaicus]|uniref:Uncharacterized protein n=1 Tax=Galemys pyrenaicus TaxID=202257 RepID=A0A8J6ADE6_GALPY|nr:hypothetical protein J0S82_013517 [Galemys pyrenaicus]